MVIKGVNDCDHGKAYSPYLLSGTCFAYNLTNPQRTNLILKRFLFFIKLR